MSLTLAPNCKTTKKSCVAITRPHATRSDPQNQRHPRYPGEPSVLDACPVYVVCCQAIRLFGERERGFGISIALQRDVERGGEVCD
jgi:hypothetical protein